MFNKDEDWDGPMRPLVALSLLTLAFAGCTDNDAYVPDEADPCLVQSADDYSCDELPVGDPDDVAHVHDYWQGRERMPILDYDLEARPTSGQGLIGCTGSPWYEIHPDDGFSVIQGTQAVEITMSWGEEPYDNHGQPQLWVKTANMRDPEYVQDIENGETVVYEVTDNADNDLPHSLLSSWQFVWYIEASDQDAADGCNYYWHHSDFHMDVDIVKGLEIPVFPAHPDQWDGGNITEITVMEHAASYNYIWGGPDPDQTSSLGATHNPWDPWLLDDGATIPYDTDRVTVELDVQSESSTHTLGLAYHAADSRELIYPDPDRVQGTTQFYEFDVERISADGPYALQSLWEFYPSINGPMQDFSGSASMTVTAYKAAD